MMYNVTEVQNVLLYPSDGQAFPFGLVRKRKFTENYSEIKKK